MRPAVPGEGRTVTADQTAQRIRAQQPATACQPGAQAFEARLAASGRLMFAVVVAQERAEGLNAGCTDAFCTGAFCTGAFCTGVFCFGAFCTGALCRAACRAITV